MELETAQVLIINESGFTNPTLIRFLYEIDNQNPSSVENPNVEHGLDKIQEVSALLWAHSSRVTISNFLSHISSLCPNDPVKDIEFAAEKEQSPLSQQEHKFLIEFVRLVILNSIFKNILS